MDYKNVKQALENSNRMNMESMFKAVPLNEEGTEFTIVFGNTIATTTIYKSKEEAWVAIDNKDWNLIATMICHICGNMLNSKSE